MMSSHCLVILFIAAYFKCAAGVGIKSGNKSGIETDLNSAQQSQNKLESEVEKLSKQKLTLKQHLR